MNQPVIHIINRLTEEQRNEFNQLRQHAIENDHFPANPPIIPSQEELDMQLTQLMTPLSPERSIIPATPRTPTPVRQRKRKSHPQLKGPEREIAERIIRHNEATIKPADLVAILKIDTTYATSLIKKFRKEKSLAVKTSKRGPKSNANENVLEYMRNFMRENCRATDKEISSFLKEKGLTDTELDSTTICRWRNDLMPAIGMEKWTVKYVSKRGANANTPENKEYRKKVMTDLQYWKRHDRIIVYIDETHFDFRRNWGKGKAPAGEKALFEGKLNLVSMSAITAISMFGPILCHIYVKETINAEKFNIFFDALLSLLGARECCFFLDNAAVHRKEDVTERAIKANQVVLFNAPYSSEMNPIENFFGIWKGMVMKEAPSTNNVEDLKKVLESTFTRIKPEYCQHIIRHISSDVMAKVMNGEDL